MTRPDDENWQAASAYLDNELSYEERIAFEARLLHEPDLLEALEDVQYVSMAMGRLRGEEQKKALDVLPGSRMRNWLIGGAVAAAIAVATIYTVIAPETSAQNPALLHEEFVSHEVTFQAMSELKHVGYSSGLFPDLSAANFMLIAEKKTEYGIAAHYSGRRNCRLTLIVGSDIPAVDNPKIQSFGWENDDREYLLVNEGMDPNRFRLIGDYLRDTATNKPTISRMAMRKKIHKTKSCS